MDIKAKVDEIVKKVQSDPEMMTKFQKDPSAAIKEITGIDLPIEQMKPVVDAVKSKIKIDGVTNLLGGLFGKKEQ